VIGHSALCRGPFAAGLQHLVWTGLRSCRTCIPRGESRVACPSRNPKNTKEKLALAFVLCQVHHIVLNEARPGQTARDWSLLGALIRYAVSPTRAYTRANSRIAQVRQSALLRSVRPVFRIEPRTREALRRVPASRFFVLFARQRTGPVSSASASVRRFIDTVVLISPRPSLRSDHVVRSRLGDHDHCCSYVCSAQSAETERMRDRNSSERSKDELPRPCTRSFVGQTIMCC